MNRKKNGELKLREKVNGAANREKKQDTFENWRKKKKHAKNGEEKKNEREMWTSQIMYTNVGTDHNALVVWSARASIYFLKEGLSPIHF